jgi:Mg-chelatase subunit ChlD
VAHATFVTLFSRVLVTACTLFSFGLSTAMAEEKQPLDTVVIMDSSGSMKLTDPKQLRKPAAKLFISLLGNQDRLSVVSFSSQAWPITYLTPLETDKQINQALKATDKISHKGAHTNIHSAISKGIEFLAESDQLNREPIIVLMSDGQMDVGNAAESQKLRQAIFDDLLPQLIERNIKIYSIAFTQASDQQLLQEIADATEGRYALAASDDVLHKVFSKIFEQTKEPNMLPLNENAFIVDSSIQEVTIIANKESDKSQIYLQTPSGKKINSTFKSETVKWFVSTSFDMITIKKPEEGDWKILFSDDDNRAYIVADIKLRTQFELNTESYNPELMIKAWLEKDEETEANQDLLNNMTVTLEVELPDGTIETLDVDISKETSDFTVNYKPTTNGFYGATMIAKSSTFQRQQTFSFRNTMPAEPEVIEEPVKAIEKPAPQPPAPEPKKEETDVVQVLIYFGIANVILIFIGLNVFFVMRYMKTKEPGKKSTDKK